MRTKSEKPRSVEEALERRGYWYPPDAIAAVREGRDTYHPYDKRVTYTMGKWLRELIQASIDDVEK